MRCSRRAIESLESRIFLASPGDLDPTFGAAGIGRADDAAAALFTASSLLALQSSGKSLIASNASASIAESASVVRFDTAGRLDATFGTAGVARYEDGSNVSIRDFAVQPDDKGVVLVQASYDPGSPGFPNGAEFLRVLRFTADGQLDPTFGGGDGVAEISGDITPTSQIARLVLQPDGSIVVGGEFTQASGVVALVALDSAGERVPTFGDGRSGIGTASVGGSFSSLILSTNASGNIYAGVGGSATQVVRFNPDGNVDGAYGDGGIAFAPGSAGPRVEALIAQNDGSALLKVGSVEGAGPVQIVKFDPTGNADQAFGTGGVATVIQDGFGGAGLAVASDGAILSTDPIGNDAGVSRLTALGALDPTFGGGDGLALVSFSETTEQIGDLAIQVDGRILVSSVATNASGGIAPGVARLEAVETVDPVEDTIAPSASITPPVVVSGSAFTDFSVAYTDNIAVDLASIATGDISVTGPSGAALVVTLQSTTPQGTGFTAVWRVAAPGGAWDDADAGSYTVSSAAGAVADTAANVTSATTVQFSVADVPSVGAGPAGELDPNFGSTGIVTFNPPGPALKTTDVLTLADGSTVAAAFTNVAPGNANVTLFKTNASGNLVAGFGGAGNGLVSLDVNGGDDRANAIFQLPDGKFLVAGTTSSFDANSIETDADMFVARFNADGTVDGTFGTNGFGVADFGPASFDRANDLVVLPDGRIVLVGGSTVSDADGDFALARFSATGVLDASFGTDGRVITNLGGADIANAAVFSNNRIVAAGVTTAGTSGGTFAVVAYSADGSSVDTTFGGASTGQVFINFRTGLDEARAIEVQNDGKFVVAGLASAGDPNASDFDSDFAFARLNADGTLDSTFGGNGKSEVDFDGVASVNSIILQPGGKILASGQLLSSLDGVGGADVRVALARLNVDGSLDTGFSDDGKFVIDFTPDVGGTSVGAFADFEIAPLADEPLTDLEAKFAQFRNDTQGLVSLVQGGAILALATQADNVVLARVFGDAGAPTLFVGIPDVREIDVASLLFVIRLIDDLAVDVSELGTGDLRVTGPNGFNQLAQFVEIVGGSASDSASVTARYRVSPAGAAFLKSDDGQYAIAIEPNQIVDVSGNFLQGGAIPNAVFTVAIPENLTNLRVDGGLTGTFPPSVVGGSKARGASVRVTNDSPLDVKATVAVTIFASTDAILDDETVVPTNDTAVATLNGVRLAVKPGRSKSLRLKFSQFPAGLPDGDYFLIARIDSGEALPELKKSDNAAATTTKINIAAAFIDLSATPGGIKGTLVPGGKATASANVLNSGNSIAKASVPVTLLLSPGDQTVGNSDIPLAGPTLKLNLKPAASKASKIRVIIPTTGLTAGNYFLIAILGPAAGLTELDDTNNLVVLGQLTV